jgi:hypothetical protein
MNDDPRRNQILAERRRRRARLNRHESISPQTSVRENSQPQTRAA